MKNKGGGTCVLLHSCGVIAATEGLPPLQGIYTGIRGARIIKKRKKNLPPLLIFQNGGRGPFLIFYVSPKILFLSQTLRNGGVDVENSHVET